MKKTILIIFLFYFLLMVFYLGTRYGLVDGGICPQCVKGCGIVCKEARKKCSFLEYAKEYYISVFESCGVIKAK